jgi:hypothetical protein
VDEPHEGDNDAEMDTLIYTSKEQVFWEEKRRRRASDNEWEKKRKPFLVESHRFFLPSLGPWSSELLLETLASGRAT